MGWIQARIAKAVAAALRAIIMREFPRRSKSSQSGVEYIVPTLRVARVMYGCCQYQHSAIVTTDSATVTHRNPTGEPRPRPVCAIMACALSGTSSLPHPCARRSMAGPCVRRDIAQRTTACLPARSQAQTIPALRGEAPLTHPSRDPCEPGTAGLINYRATPRGPWISRADRSRTGMPLQLVIYPRKMK